MAKDLVCKMDVNEKTAKLKSEYNRPDIPIFAHQAANPPSTRIPQNILNNIKRR